MLNLSLSNLSCQCLQKDFLSSFRGKSSWDATNTIGNDLHFHLKFKRSHL